MQNQDSLQTFIDTLLKERGIDQETPAVIAAARRDLERRINTRISARIMERLPEADLPAFEQLLAEGDDQAVQQFCSERVENLDSVIAESLLELRQTWV